MTRINVVPPKELCDEHLRAELRELTRIPNAIAKNRLDISIIPINYTLGKGHIKFFGDKLYWLRKRHLFLIAECKRRGFKTTDFWPKQLKPIGNYIPTTEAIKINRDRIKERWPKNPHYYGVTIKN